MKVDGSATNDPVRALRARIAHWTLVANRVGYLAMAVAVALFFVALAVGFNGAMSTAVVVFLVVACLLLAPSIVLGYAVKAAERHDHEHGH